MRLIKIIIPTFLFLVSLNLKAQTYDPDAQKHFVATGITNDTIKCAINRLVIGLKDSSLWSKMVAIYHMSGRDAFKNSYNLKDTSTYKLTYTGTLYHSATGVKSDVATGRINTNCPSNATSQNSTALSFYSNDNVQFGTYDMAGIYNLYNWLYIRNFGDNALIGTHSGNYKTTYNNNSQGLFTSSRTASNLTTLYRNGVVIDTSSIVSSTPDATNIYIFGNDATSSVSRECSFASISEGLSAAEVRALSHVVDSFHYYLAHGGCSGEPVDTTHNPTPCDSNWVRSGNNIYNLNSGNVGIGTTTPDEKLSVNGTILARRVKVSVDSGVWADYVFDNKYRIPSLDKIEEYIKRNKHLPGIPSAGEVGKNGLDLGESHALLLKKIEELTLIIIQQNKTQAGLKKLIYQQQKRISSLENKNRK